MKQKYHGVYDKYGRLLLPVTVDKDSVTNTTFPEIVVTPYKRNLREDVDKGKKEFVNKALEIAEGTGLAAAVGGVAGGVGKAIITKSAKPVIDILKPVIGSVVGYKVGEKIDESNGGKTGYKTAGALIGGAIGGIIPGAKKNFGLIDKYSTPMGYFGYYGNKKDRLVQTLIKNGTIKNNFLFKEKPKYPELLRKSKTEFYVKDGKVGLSRERKDGVEEDIITNFTTDRPVVSNRGVYWDDADLYIINPTSINRKDIPKSIEPSDHFYLNLKSKPDAKDVTFVSGDKGKLLNAKDYGMETLSSKKARQLYDEIKINKNWGDFSRKPTKEEIAYADEIQRLQSLRGTPSLQDYKKLNKRYKKKSYVIENKENTINDINEKFFSKNTMYPNGKIPSKELSDFEAEALNRAKYNRVFYDPATNAENDFITRKNEKTNNWEDRGAFD